MGIDRCVLNVFIETQAKQGPLSFLFYRYLVFHIIRCVNTSFLWKWVIREWGYTR